MDSYHDIEMRNELHVDEVYMICASSWLQSWYDDTSNSLLESTTSDSVQRRRFVHPCQSFLTSCVSVTFGVYGIRALILESTTSDSVQRRRFVHPCQSFLTSCVSVTFGVYGFRALILMVVRLCVLFMMCHFEVVMTTRE